MDPERDDDGNLIVADPEGEGTGEGEGEGEPTGVENIPTREDELQTQLQTERETNARLQGQIEARNEQPPPAPAKEEAPPKEFTREELRAGVNEQRISEDQMEQIWADQQYAKTMRGTEELINQRETERTTAFTVDSEYDKYVETFPTLKDTKSDDWGKVKHEYDYQVRMGFPETRATEVVAMRAALGSSTRISERTAELRETTQETGGGSQGGSRPVDIWNRVPKYLRAGYKKMVSDGYKTLEDVEKDIPYMKARPQ